MKVMKHEWHQVDCRYTFEITEDFLAEVYPDLTEVQIKTKMMELYSGLTTPDEIFDDAWDAEIDVDWDHDYDDWWTSRKGGYDVTYDIIEGQEEEEDKSE